jgi:hypothetical protein
MRSANLYRTICNAGGQLLNHGLIAAFPAQASPQETQQDTQDDFP